MEILKRAKSGGEIVSPFESEANVKEEVDRRTARAGYTNKYGEPMGRTKISVGWTRKYENNYERIFGKE